MKITWEADDIRPGRRIGRPDRKEVWMIGYRYSNAKKKLYLLVSLNDGMVSHECANPADLAEYINSAEEIPVELL